MTCVHYSKKQARLILDADCSERSAHLFRKLGWMPLSDRLKYQRAVQMYKCLNKECPLSLQDMFTLKAKVHNYRTRPTTNENLHFPKCHQKSFLYTGTKTWNNVPRRIRKSNNVYSFKKLYRKALLQHTNIRLVTVQVSSECDTVFAVAVLETLAMSVALKLSNSSAKCITLLK